MQICAFDDDTDACAGDSGGPLAYKDAYYYPRQKMIVGVVSYGPVECNHRQ